MARKTALQTVERQGWETYTYFDSMTHAEMFRKYKPHSFGVKTAQLFSSEIGSHLINKKFTYMTVAKKNYYLLPSGIDDYEWFLVADVDVDYRATELLVDPSMQAGRGGLPFRIALDREWLHEPAIIKCESADLPMIKVIGHPKQRSSNSFEYEVELQTGDLNAWIPTDYLMPGRKFIDASTSVSTELNTKYAGDQYGDMFKLQSWTGVFARKAEFTDKFIRMEIGCRKEGRSMPKSAGYSIGGRSYNDGAVSQGYVYQQKFAAKGSGVATNGQKNMYEAGVFITKLEARLEERVLRDREMNFEFGQLQKTKDHDSQRYIKVAPGWRQLVRDGHYKEHNGTLSLSELYEFIAEIFLTRRSFSDRHIVIATGEAGIEWLNRMISQEIGNLTLVDSTFVNKTNSPYHSNAYEFGAQFTKIKLPMGYVLEMVYDPIKDDRKLFPELAPGTNRTLESYTMDIFDFGATNQKAFDAKRSENITCVMEDGKEEYYHVSNVYNFQTGSIKDGGNARSNSKELGVYREISGGLCIWDIGRVGRIAFNPFRVGAAY